MLGNRGDNWWVWPAAVAVVIAAVALVGFSVADEVVELAGPSAAVVALLVMVVMLVLIAGMVGVQSTRTSGVLVAVALIAVVVSVGSLFAWNGNASAKTITVTEVSGEPETAYVLTEVELQHNPALEKALTRYRTDCLPAGETTCTVRVSQREYKRARAFLAGEHVVRYRGEYYTLWFGQTPA